MPRASEHRSCAIALLLAAGLVAIGGPPPVNARSGDYDTTWRQGGRTVIGGVPTSGTPAAIARVGSNWGIGGADFGSACAIRLLPNGDLDPTYGIASAFCADLSSIPSAQNRSVTSVVSPDGRVLLLVSDGGQGDQRAYVARIRADGTSFSDLPFGFQFASGESGSQLIAAAIGPDGLIYVAGSTRDRRRTSWGVAKFNAALMLDPTLDGDGRLTMEFGANTAVATSLLIDPAGRILIAGITLESNVRRAWVVRLLPDGSPDLSFGNAGRTQLPWSTTGGQYALLARDAQGRLVVGSSCGTDLCVSRLSEGGSLDTGFAPGGRINISFGDLVSPGGAELRSMLVDDAGNYVLGGTALLGSDSPPRTLFAIARVRSDGTLDPGFGADGRSVGTYGPLPLPANSSDTVEAMAFDPAGRLMVAGKSTDSGGIARFGAARIVTGVGPLLVNGFEQ